MRLLFLVRGLFPSLMKAVVRGAIALLLAGVLTTAGAGLAQAAYAPDKCPTTGILGPGTGNDLLIDTVCHVGGGTYSYANVNIVNGGSLIFDESARTLNLRIDFWASAILVEYGGSLMAGSSPGTPFGTYGGRLTIHLYGADQGTSGIGITCKSNWTEANPSPNPPCGIPTAVWNANGMPVSLPGGSLKVPQYTDIFYQYGALPFDDKVDPVTNSVGYFGYKVLAVSEGGTLQLFGKKGAYYGTPDLGPQKSGTSWVRLQGTILPKATSLTIPGQVDWQEGDHIVVTTTDYLPNHSEELVICSIAGNSRSTTTIGFDTNLQNPCPIKPGVPQGVQWTHNGEQFPLTSLPSRLQITKTAAETRAAVGLLTRSIRIVAEGTALGQGLPSPTDPSTNRYFGGHTIVRQGFAAFQVQGVEFRQLGEGGKLGHYPIHFHLARTTPPNTFVKDSSINESMTRWITVHGTSGVLLERNVGYLSIGHGFYLEDAVETNNQFYSNLGIFARAAVSNAQNPRTVPGILASPDETANYSVQFESDKNNPAVFWITNGWNDFQGNMAAGAGMCGLCFWEIPASISGPSLGEQWTSYASEQTATRTGSSPLKNFDGNFCTSAMTSFQTVGYTENCPGAVGPNKVVVPVLNPYAPPSTATSPTCGPGTSYPLCPADYYPNINPGILNQATQCPATGPCNDQTAILCQDSNETNCLPTVINNYTTSFHWAQYNFAAVWLRTRWHLVSNSFISDVQNAGLTFISGGDYTHSSAIGGLWELALKTVFVGETQPADMDHGYSSVLSPFNSITGLTCDNPPAPYCVSKDNSFPLGSFTAFAVSEHMFNIYDGPAHEDSNAYLDIKKTDLLGTNSNASVYKSQLGIPKVVQIDPNAPKIPVGNCYIQNAAIAWKQPNGFYYPPTFHSNNLFFNNVDIRHYVIVPQFISGQPPFFGTYQTDPAQAALRYCQQNQNDAMFTGFSAIDRQTELTDDDGSLTGYANTISVNEDPFFAAPIDGLECQTDGATPEGGTARTSPYAYVTTVVYPDAAKNASPPPKGQPPMCQAGSVDPNWDSNCSTPNCFGVPLYREYLTGSELVGGKAPPIANMPFIRMAGMNLCQRETMTVNHGHYYVDLTASSATQSSWPPDPAIGKPYRNVFIGGNTYDFFEVYATQSTEQTFQMYIGAGLPVPLPPATVQLIRVNIDNAPFQICPDVNNPKCPPVGGDSTTLNWGYNPTNGILTVILNLSAYANDFTSAAKALCVPTTFCKFTSKCVGQAGVFTNLTQAERDTACGYAGKDIDCPTGGCVGFSVTLPGGPNGFVANDQTIMQSLPSQLATCFPNDATWNVTPVTASPTLAGSCYKAPIKSNFCQMAIPQGTRFQ